MKLHELSPAKGSKKEAKRVGRGHGSGHGKTSGKGHKGQWARSGGGVKPGFEGGQMKIAMRIPKRGFNNKVFANEYAIVNVRDLEKRFESGDVIDCNAIIESGLIKKPLNGIKILGTGELTKSFTVKAAKFSETAKTKIENAGGKAELEQG
ncbi:MAG: 50S ribosomal protein L15 [Oscillospiraceae bacterium]|nr:50S ribosomal protein L15 [Oscillospiraceae bacterium]